MSLNWQCPPEIGSAFISRKGVHLQRDGLNCRKALIVNWWVWLESRPTTHAGNGNWGAVNYPTNAVGGKGINYHEHVLCYFSIEMMHWSL